MTFNDIFKSSFLENVSSVTFLDIALTLILATMKNLPLYDAEVRSGGWARYSMRELSYKTVGLMGFGRIGKRLAELLKGFDVKVLAYDPYLPPEVMVERGAEPVSFDELLARSDVVSLHLPATEATRHIINAETIAKMKEGAYLVNTSRGILIDEAALLEALKSHKLGGAGLDVYEKEPVTAENPLFKLDNDVLAPHVSALTYETNYNAGIICANSIINVLHGERPVHALW